MIAADDAMIKHAVRRHFGDVDDELVTNYFDKLIQLPIRVPPLGTQEVHHAYYNFCRVHQTLRVTPCNGRMEADLADHVWSLEELVGLLKQKVAEAAA